MNRAYLIFCAGLVAMGCSSSSSDDGPKRSESVIDALVRAVKFDDGRPRQGDIATLDPSVGSVSLVTDDSQLDIGPGVVSLLDFDVDGVDDDDAVVATLLQFDGADQHVRVPVEAEDAGASRIENPFHVEDDVCQFLCNKIYTARLSFAVELHGGKVTRKSSIAVQLDCRDDGDEELCQSGDGDGDGDGDGGGSTLDSGAHMDAGGGDGDGDASAGSDAAAPDGGAGTQPVVSMLTPALATAGQAFTLEIAGSGFTEQAQAYLDGQALPTTFVSDTLVQIEVPASNTLAGSLAVVVEGTEGDPSTRSNVLYLQVTAAPGAPVVYDYSPDNGVPGDTISIIASGLAGDTLTIEDAEGNPLEPGTLGTISWPTAGSVDTVEVVLPDDMATGPITVSNTMGSYRGKIFSVGLNLTRAEGTTLDSSTQYNDLQWSRVSGADNLLATSFFTAHGDCATVTTCTTVPFYTITLASDQLVGRIAMRGNREYASGYDFIRGSFELLDASGDTVWHGTYDLPGPDRDLDITLSTPIKARALRFESRQDESDEPGFSELELFGP